jgi:hypothetical protein
VNLPVPRKFAAAYKHPLFFCIHTRSGYRSSAFDPQGAQHLLPPDSDNATLGRAVSDALAHSHFFSVAELETTKFFDFKARQSIYAAWIENLMNTCALKTKKALFKDLDHCGIESVDSQVAITPKRHVKLEAWEQLATPAPDIKISASASPDEIGAALRHAFSFCTQG